MLLLAMGCHRDNVQVYQTSSDQDQPQPSAPAPGTNATALPPGHPDISSADNSSVQMPSGVAASDVQNAPPLIWTTPPGWTSVKPSEMRVASFKVAGANGKTADVSIVPLAGTGGGDFANVNRWRGQVGLPDTSDDELQKTAENVGAAGQSAQLFDIAGQDKDSGAPTRIIGVIQHRDETSWFYKMTGDADLVEQQKPAFITFLKSLSFGSESAQAEAPPANPDASSMSAPVATITSTQSTQGQPNWQVPPGWQSVAAGQFLVAKFMVKSDNGAAADVNVSSSSGDGGGLGPNVNRWRSQIGLPPVDEFPTTTFEVPGGQGQLVDMSGTNTETSKPAQIIAAVVTIPGQTWFYKLMGDPSIVAAQKGAFTQFVKGVQY